jgi:hypothetical protein
LKKEKAGAIEVSLHRPGAYSEAEHLEWMEGQELASGIYFK